jgi:hypothetical protein
MRFERDEGFFLGAWVINYAAVGAVIFVVLMAVIAVEATNHGGALLALVVAGAVAAAVTPIVTYPWSRTLWVAIELIMRPLEAREVASADQAQVREHGLVGRVPETDVQAPEPPLE